ncbi:MAG: imidazolonepropionase [Anaeromyxobacter sp.]
MSAAKPRATLAVRRAQLATCDRGPSDPGLLPGGAVALAGETVAWTGPDAELERAVDLAGAEVVDARGGLVTPGLVDAHTHLLFAGDRSGEFALRCAGKSYLEIAAAGGGIGATTRATAAASDEALLEAAVARARRLLAQGVTTVEVKSGYGLEPEAELRLLGLIHQLGHALRDELTVVPTLLAHAVPPARAASREAHVAELAGQLVPAAALGGLAQACDVFVEQGAFTPEEARAILGAARAAGLTTRVHVDQLTPGRGAQLAAELGCASADHLEAIDEEGIQALARAGVVAGLLPTATFFLGLERYAPGRRLLDAGATVALATNLNPGSAMTENVGLTLSLACLKLGLTAAEALVAFTAGSALALRRPSAGRLAPGADADLVVWGAATPEHLAWHLGMNHAQVVVRRGRVVHRAGPEAVDCRE